MGFITTSIFDVFQAGPGPSSSHTIGPMEAAGRFRRLMEELVDKELQSVTTLEVRLFGSLSATGKGHGTDRAVTAGLMGWLPATCNPEALANLLTPGNENPSVTIRDIVIPFHKRNIHFDSVRHSAPYNNTLIMRLLAGKRVILEKEYYSVGGGAVRSKGDRSPARPSPPYPYACMTGLRTILSAGKIGLIELVLKNEEQISGIGEHDVARKLDEILAIMETSVNRGLHATGRLPGPIGLERKAAGLYEKARSGKAGPDKFFVFLDAYAMAVAEENAAGSIVVTAPTSGSAGVVPSMLYLLKHHFNTPRELLHEGMLVAAVIAFITKHNASIAGAEVGCQGEIGVASSMAAALLAHVNKQGISVVENAAEIALEHHLGMTCDPIRGYVQIPCIERNAVGAVEAYNAYLLASSGDPKKQKISFDEVVEAMLKTGRDMSMKYKETSEGGLAVCAINC